MRMMRRTDHRFSATFSGIAVLCTMLALGTPQFAAATEPTSTETPSTSPLPESDYTTRSACTAPEPGHAGCLAVELVPHTSTAQAHTHPLGMSRSRPIQAATPQEGSFGLRPQDLRDAYFPGKTELPDAPASEPQTIALIDAYNDPNARADLETYEKAFGLNKCSAATNACFEQLNQEGESTNLPFPASETARKEELAVCEDRHETTKKREDACNRVSEAEGWAVEISTDIEVSRAVCQNCKILLVEADSAEYSNLESAENTAAALATEVSNSWGGQEEGSDSQAFNHPGTVITAAAGDDGYLNWTEAATAKEAEEHGEKTGYFVGADYPASSPHVVAVGGTSLTVSDGTRQSETVWNEDPDPEDENEGAGGGGCSEYLTAQPWQQKVPDWSRVGCGPNRAVSDVSADADPYTGVAVYDSVPTFHENATGKVVNTPLEWWPIGGTSVASPIIASMFALAGGAHGVSYPAETLYAHMETAALYDVTKGGNGKCDDIYTSCSGSLNKLNSAFPFDCGEGSLICNAAPGCGDEYYDGPVGVGTPNEIAAFEPGSLPALTKPKCEQKSNPSKEPPPSEPPISEEGGATGSHSENPKEGESQAGENPGGTPPGGSSPVSPGGASQSATGSSVTTTGSATMPVPQISALALTQNARAALRRARLHVGQLAFSFKLSSAATVRLEVSVRSRSHPGARERWRMLPGSLTFAAIRGLNRRELHGSSRLGVGVYRLLLIPTGGKASSIVVRVP
jgi:hypothetical protein